MEGRAKEQMDDSIKKTGTWSKYGGGEYGVVRAEIEHEWSCQLCGAKQPRMLRPYLYQIFGNEYLRVCSVCYQLIQQSKNQDLAKLMQQAREKRKHAEQQRIHLQTNTENR